MANENSNVTLTTFDKLFREDAQVNAKNESVSAEMLKAMWEYNGPETTFDKVWISNFYGLESKHKGDHLRELFSKLSPVEFESWMNDSELDEKSAPDKKTANAYANRKVEAKKKVKAAENRIRRVIEALAGIRFNPVPVKKMNVKAGKLICYSPFVDEETNEMDEESLVKAEFSMAELIKAGTQFLVKEQLKTTSPRTPGSTSSGSAKTAEDVLSDIAKNDKSQLAKACDALTRTLALADKRSAYEGETADALQNLAGEILRHFYSNDDGSALDQEMILDWLDTVEAKVFTGEENATEEKVA